MSYIESSFYGLKEYEAEKSSRLLEVQLEQDELYTACFSLKKIIDNQKREAAKIPVRMIGLEELADIGRYTVDLSALDNDLKTVVNVGFDSRDGLLSDVKDSLRIVNPNDPEEENYPIMHGYIKPYENYFDGLMNTSTGVYIPKTELVTV